MEEFKRIPFGGNPYADFEFFKVELKVCDVKYTPEQIYAHFEFTRVQSRCTRYILSLTNSQSYSSSSRNGASTYYKLITL